MANEKKSFIIYENWATLFANIPEEQAGQIIKAICCKKLGMEYEISDPMAAGVFAMISPQLDKDAEKYDEIVQKKKVASQKRWNKKQTDSSQIQNDTHASENDAHAMHNYPHALHVDSDNDTDNDTDTDTVSPTESNNTRAREDHSEYAAKIEQITEYLNSVTGSKYRPTKDIADLIVERLDDGFSVDDFKTVIDKKYRHWGNDAKFKHFLTPSTLFGSKFQNYLNESGDVIPEARSDITKTNSFDFGEHNDYDDSALAKMMFAKASDGF